ncbi:MAG TPA: type II toxin-antitoxin system VapB family antitoxin [Pseudonocardiaceae bacterium]|nr:type II toxin-antitoxin system VapB family antitoxin [Pseudonocardiaceae bacterium]
MARRTTIEVDDALVREAARILGTTGLKDTVNSALKSVIRAQHRRRLAERLRTGEGVDFGAETATAARTWRSG